MNLGWRPQGCFRESRRVPNGNLRTSEISVSRDEKQHRYSPTTSRGLWVVCSSMTHIDAFLVPLGHQFTLLTSHHKVYSNPNSNSLFLDHWSWRAPRRTTISVSHPEVDPCTMKLNPGTVTYPIEVHKDAYAHSPSNLWNVGELFPNELTSALVVQSIVLIDVRFSVPNMDSSNASLRPGGEAYHSRLGL